MKNIRNFGIIAHIDHGKSTLADRFLEITKTITSREMREQFLDTMDLERERGITIKLQPVQMKYHYRGANIQSSISNNKKIENQKVDTGSEYILNLIDTPGHVDFSYEVSRSLAAVEGVILLVDASQGIEAQTLANLHLAKENKLKIIPVISKIDLPSAHPDRVAEEIQNILGVNKEEILRVSGKTGEGIKEVLDTVIERVPQPKGDTAKPLRALVFDSYFDAYRGVIAYIRVVDGEVRTGCKIKLMASNDVAEASEVGIFAPKLTKSNKLSAGEIGYIATGLKDVAKVQVGDTITLAKPAPNSKSEILNSKQKVEPLPGYKKVLPFVYASIFTIDNNDYPKLRKAMDKLKLNDAALVFEPENSPALGFGFRCGFLGLLHMEIVQERLKREFGLDLVVTTPSVSYEIRLAGDRRPQETSRRAGTSLRVLKLSEPETGLEAGLEGEKQIIHNPAELPEANRYKTIAEPWINLEIIVPSKYVGGIMKLVQEKRGIQKNVTYLDAFRTLMVYEIPLSSVITGFYDNLKSVSSGYASMSYEFLEYREEALVKIDILVNGKKVDSLSVIVHKSLAQKVGKELVANLKKVIPRQSFKIPIQAAIGGKIIAREDIAPYRKDVLAKLYGGDRTRKDKLLGKQAKGKKRMKMVGKVEIPQEAFLRIMSE